MTWSVAFMLQNSVCKRRRVLSFTQSIFAVTFKRYPWSHTFHSDSNPLILVYRNRYIYSGREFQIHSQTRQLVFHVLRPPFRCLAAGWPSAMQATSLDNYLIILDNCPMLNIPGFTFPVRQHFLEEIIKILRYWLGQRETLYVNLNRGN